MWRLGCSAEMAHGAKLLSLLAPCLVFGATHGRADELKPAELAKRVGPAVVLIKAVTSDGSSTGSGFVVDSSGTIVTNLHVIRGATAVAVKLPSGDVYDQVKVRAFDERKDLAVIQILAFGLPTVPLGNSDTVQQGDPVVLYGNPLGLEGSLSAGVVSGVRSSEAGFKVLQTDASANPGNSGGPLIGATGEVIGVLSFKLRGSEGLNFAVPINYARGLLAASDDLSLGELTQRLSANVDVFEQKPSFPARWKSLMSGTTKTVRVDGDRLYVETVIDDPAQRRYGAFGLAELKKDGDKYVGTWRDRMACAYNATDWSTLGTKEVVNVCTLETRGEVTLLTATRIEGWVEDWVPGAKFNCKKCEYNSARRKSPFAWIPE